MKVGIGGALSEYRRIMRAAIVKKKSRGLPSYVLPGGALLNFWRVRHSKVLLAHLEEEMMKTAIQILTNQKRVHTYIHAL